MRHDVLDLMASLVPSDVRRQGTIALLHSGGPGAELAAMLHEAGWHNLSAREVPSSGLEGLHVWLTGLGPFDCVIDAAEGDRVARASRALFHCRPGSPYVLVFDSEPDVQRNKIENWLTSIRAIADSPEPPRVHRDRRPLTARYHHALAASLVADREHSKAIVLRHSARVLPAVHDQRVDRIFKLRGERKAILATIPGQDFTSLSSFRVSEGSLRKPIDPSWRAPRLSVRRWSNVVCLPRGLALAETMVLPASFSSQDGRLRHREARPWAPGFLAVPNTEPERLEGSWFFLDNSQRGHFGHALTEQLSSTWGWEHAVAHDPSMRALVSAGRDRPLADWELQLFEAAGIPRDRIHVINRPVRVDNLITASQAYSRANYVHPRIIETYERTAQHLAGQSSVVSPPRLFLSRRPGNRTCHNAAAVEQFHADRGFDVVYPEDLSLADQVALVREARVISGFAGSAMFQVAFTSGPRHVIAITSESYPAHNEYLICAMRGHRLDLVLCRPEIAHEGGFNIEAFHSPFTFDFEREGQFLTKMLHDVH